MKDLITPYSEYNILLLSQIITDDTLECEKLKSYFFEKIKKNKEDYEKTFNEILEEFDLKVEKVFTGKDISIYSGKERDVYAIRVKGNTNMIMSFRLEEELCQQY